MPLSRPSPEHHRDLTALSGVLQARPGECYRRNGTGFVLLHDLKIGNSAKRLAMAEQNADVLKVLICQIAENRDLDPVSAKRSAYSDMPSFASQSAICGVAPTFRPRLSWLNRAFAYPQESYRTHPPLGPRLSANLI